MFSKITSLSFLSNTVTKPFDYLFKECQCDHFEINNIVQVLSGRVNSDYLILLLDINYFSFDGFLNDKSQVNMYWAYDSWVSPQTTSMSKDGDKWSVNVTVSSNAQNRIIF